MAWNNDRYYTRSKRVNGRIVREYVGTGPHADLVAKLDALNRERRAIERAEARAAEDRIIGDEQAREQLVDDLDNLADLVAAAALLEAGFHLHKREWRKTGCQKQA